MGRDIKEILKSTAGSMRQPRNFNNFVEKVNTMPNKQQVTQQQF